MIRLGCFSEVLVRFIGYVSFTIHGREVWVFISWLIMGMILLLGFFSSSWGFLGGILTTL